MAVWVLLPGTGCGIPKYRMASDVSLADFANRPRGGRAWADDLPDDVFNQIWDALHSTSGIGKVTVAKWLRALGYEDATQGRVDAVMSRGRR